METTLLKRQALAWETNDFSSDFPTGGLELEARDLLGYEPLAKEVTKTRVRDEKARKHAALLQTLAELDIRPFTGESVKAYKESCARSASKLLARAAQALGMLAALACVGSLVMLIVAGMGGFPSISFYAAWTLFLSPIAVGLFVRLEEGLAVERKWAWHSLAGYKEPVPEFVLQTAVDIRKAHPFARFYVCALEENRVVADPFLVLRIDDGETTHNYHLEVWNESRFTDEREV